MRSIFIPYTPNSPDNDDHHADHGDDDCADDVVLYMVMMMVMMMTRMTSMTGNTVVAVVAQSAVAGRAGGVEIAGVAAAVTDNGVCSDPGALKRQSSETSPFCCHSQLVMPRTEEDAASEASVRVDVCSCFLKPLEAG